MYIILDSGISDLQMSPFLPPSLQATITISPPLSSTPEESESRLTLIFVIIAVIIAPIIIIAIITVILWRVSSLHQGNVAVLLYKS